MLNSEYKKQKFAPAVKPWSHWVFDQVFEGTYFKACQSRILKTETAFLTRADDPEELQFSHLPDIELFKYFMGSEFRSFLERNTGEKLELYKTGSIQLRKMTEDSPAFPPHHDFIDHRTLVMLFYLSPGWQPSNGGEISLLKDKTTSLQSEDCLTLAPLENRMILFFSDETNWHAVAQVHDWTRYLVMAEWTIL